MFKRISKIRKLSPFFLFLFTLFLTPLLTLPWVGAQEPPKPKPQDWQINGIVAAIEDSYPEVKKAGFYKLAEYEPQDLKAMLKKPEDIAQKAANFLKDDTVEEFFRRSAAAALGNLGETGAKYVPDILNIIKDETLDPFFRRDAATALGNLGEAGAKYAPDIANILKDKTLNLFVHLGAAEALSNMGKAGATYTPDILNFLQDETVDPNARYDAAESLGNMREVIVPYIPDIASLLKDETIDLQVRGSVAVVLGNLGEAAAPYIPDILNFLKNEKTDYLTRHYAATTLGNIRKLELNEVILILSNAYEIKQKYFEYWRFLTYFLSGGTDDVKTLMKWLGNPQELPTQLNNKEGQKTLEVFIRVWENAQELPRLQNDLAEKIAVVTRLVSWKSQDIDLLQHHYNNLKAGNLTEANAVESVINNILNKFILKS
ncbi:MULTISPECIES: HEAT repeat domain-containing protein [unclassified Coleofasciculus]|uniref:HEAT repeat domain-containing protein n=1 Tax=unclassified Coleofasciculus TaxID=2692782 RepID=UPI00187FCC40|nr:MULTISPECIES: HEAT repeat domain-containing protein [unclassified Coleofasciculus]MBE9129388.1 HEAT repeat domain-containing protein [Coleofasciculus sp. LEGE 07081]MBE9152022.1 HEAT repeat domain-containing protein [Coleofasciculus sp. LEGE 07092]